MQDTVQRAQPEGVPPLELTGERTLPDVPAENYWFRRHLAVYEWVAERCQGRDVVDMACGEGYGVDVLARRARRATGVDANPEAHEHARLKYARPGVRFVRDLVGQIFVHLMSWYGTSSRRTPAVWSHSGRFRSPTWQARTPPLAAHARTAEAGEDDSRGAHSYLDVSRIPVPGPSAIEADKVGQFRNVQQAASRSRAETPG